MNRTFGDRIGPANLSEILHGMAKRLMRMDEIASFEIIPELEGYYSCGVSTPDSSPIKRFVCKFIEISENLLRMLLLL